MLVIHSSKLKEARKLMPEAHWFPHSCEHPTIERITRCTTCGTQGPDLPEVFDRQGSQGELCDCRNPGSTHLKGTYALCEFTR